MYCTKCQKATPVALQTPIGYLCPPHYAEHSGLAFTYKGELVVPPVPVPVPGKFQVTVHNDGGVDVKLTSPVPVPFLPGEEVLNAA